MFGWWGLQEILLRFMQGIDSQLTESDLLLLRVLYAPDSVARLSWHSFRENGHQIETLNEEALTFLPLLKKRLVTLFHDDPYLLKLKGHHRHTWTQNQVKLKKLSDCLAQLEAAGIVAIVINDAAIALYSEGDTTRPIGAQCLLVKPEDHPQALALLQASQAPVQVWSHLPGNLQTRVFAQAQSLSINGRQSLVIAPPDLLLCHLLSMKYQKPNQALWFTDTVRIMAASSSEQHRQTFISGADDACLTLPALKAWSFFQAVGKLVEFNSTNCQMADAFDTMPISMKELAQRCASKLRALI
jgi:hypothetical protein